MQLWRASTVIQQQTSHGLVASSSTEGCCSQDWRRLNTPVGDLAIFDMENVAGIVRIGKCRRVP